MLFNNYSTFWRLKFLFVSFLKSEELAEAKKNPLGWPFLLFRTLFNLFHFISRWKLVSNVSFNEHHQQQQNEGNSFFLNGNIHVLPKNRMNCWKGWVVVEKVKKKTSIFCLFSQTENMKNKQNFDFPFANRFLSHTK